MFLAKQRGFTLIELLMVVAIIGILVSVAVPRYRVYSNKARFIEGTMTLAPHRNGVLIATSGGRVDALTELDAGVFGIPPAQAAAASTHGVDVVDGVITFTWQSDGTPLAGQTYVLTPDGILPPIQWTSTGSCFTNDYC